MQRDKQTAFLWQWSDYAPLPDPLMTRARAARLLRAWRNARIQGRRQFSLQRTTSADGRYRVYRCNHIRYSDPGALWIPRDRSNAL